MIAVHCGAGRYNSKTMKDYKALGKKACRRAIKVLENGGTSLEAVKAAIIVLENDPLTNAGFGSNLTSDGIVECDASVMNGENLVFGACGAVRKIKNPISLAYDIYEKQLETLPFGLVPPQLLVGLGAYKHAKLSGLQIVKDSKLVSPKALKYHKRIGESIKKIELRVPESVSRNDTVGAVCIDTRGHVAAGCSSGGVLFKRPGRVGQAAVYGTGLWADSSSESEAIAVCTTGCGEQLVQTHLAKTIAEDLINGTCPTIDLHKSMNEKFMKSKYLQHSKVPKLCGALVLKADRSRKEVSLLWGHSTLHLAVSYMKLGSNKAQSQISILPEEVQECEAVIIGGTEFYFRDDKAGAVYDQ